VQVQRFAPKSLPNPHQGENAMSATQKKDGPQVIDAKELNGNAKTVLDPLNQDEIAALKKPADDYVLRLAKKWVATIKDISNVQQAINIGERDLNESRALWSKLDGKLEAIAESYIDSKN
jgi:hypothetical protein